MSIESIRSHYGFSRAPFGKDIPPQLSIKPLTSLRRPS